MNLAKTINTLLQKEGISQAELARRIGLSPQAISNVMKSRHSLSFQNAVKIIEALNHEITFKKVDDEKERLVKMIIERVSENMKPETLGGMDFMILDYENITLCMTESELQTLKNYVNNK